MPRAIEVSGVNSSVSSTWSLTTDEKNSAMSESFLENHVQSSQPDEIAAAVAKLYNTYPFPPEPLLDEPPPGYNWRWNWVAAHSFCTGQKPHRENIRILDAGCGTGVGTEYLVHLNPHAEVIGIDLSEGALDVARERCRRSGANRVEFQPLSIYDAAQLPGEFELINCVGVLHHMADPQRGIQALAQKLAPGGFLHIFVYAELGRWEIRLMQEAIAILQGTQRGDYEDGVEIGRDIFANLPEHNRLLTRERERWSLENQRDANFADMYVHPQEIDYNINSLFELIDASGLEFIGFSNPEYWDLKRLMGDSPKLMQRADSVGKALNPKERDRQRYRLIELLDPEITHYEFFLGRRPYPQSDWSQDSDLLAAIPERHPCIDGWPGNTIFNADYKVIQLTEAQQGFLRHCGLSEPDTGHPNSDRPLTVDEILSMLSSSYSIDLNEVRNLFRDKLIVLSPS